MIVIREYITKPASEGPGRDHTCGKGSSNIIITIILTDYAVANLKRNVSHQGCLEDRISLLYTPHTLTPLLTPLSSHPHTSFSHLSPHTTPHTSSSHLILTPLSSHPSSPHMPTAPHQGEWNGGEGLRSHQEKKVPPGHPQQMFAAEGMTTVSTHITRWVH